jgi:beta-1,4-glucosyltransferase
MIRSNFDGGEQTLLAYANTNLITFAHRNPGLADALNTRFMVVNDGIGVEIAARLVNGGAGFLENLNGTDFNIQALRSLPEGTKVFFYGARPGVAGRAAKVAREKFGIDVVGTLDGYAAIEREKLVRHINATGAQVVVVALGNPKQEQWIVDHAPLLDARLLIGVGALLDFISGEVPRAPQWVRSLRMEWLYRLMHEPRRLVRRYTLDIVHFLAIALSWRWLGPPQVHGAADRNG